MEEETLKYKLGISLIPKIGPVFAKKLIAYCGSIEGVFKEKKRHLLNIPRVGKLLADQIVIQNVMEQAEREISFIKKNNIQAYFYLDEDYPERLKQCIDAPIIFYMKGSIDLNHTKILSIVGTRNATQYGIDFCNKFVHELTIRNHNVIIVSGLAYGIDIAAHKAALNNNLSTIAVLGHGLNTIYPAVHNSLARKISGQGALLTEFHSSSIVDKPNFVRRNRIIAGIADATIVVESGERGGALITADIANSYNRDVFAVPGRSNDTCSKGTNKLIKTNKAYLLEEVKDLEYIMGWENIEHKPDAMQKKLFVSLTEDEKKVLETLSVHKKMSIDILYVQTQLPMSKVSSILLNLEFSGLVKSLPGKIYAIS